MRIGIVPVLNRSWGGVYQYSVTLLDALAEVNSGDEFLLFIPKNHKPPSEISASPFQMVEMPESSTWLGRMWTRLPTSVRSRLAGLASPIRSKLLARRRRDSTEDTTWREWFGPFGLDLLFFTIENDISYRTGVPYVVVVHDLQHKLQPQLPEFADRAEWERREERMRNSIANATLVVVDSEVGREDVLSCYSELGIAEDAVRPLPFVPAHYVAAVVPEVELRRVRVAQDLPEMYLFYPAQFWPHKNHKRIVEALGLLAREGLRLPLVLVGSRGESALRAETFATVMQTARELGVDDLVRYLGYVGDDDMSALYAQATALVMPTFFGPTNIPILEAWRLGCPVITSDIRGVREQAGDAAVLVDPSSAQSIAEGIRRIVSSESLRTELIARGHARVSAYTIHDFARRLAGILDEAKSRVLADRPGVAPHADGGVS
ncbi:MAG: glycosyltransferase family 1 protein [Coriobacteriia bacterium]|nr:glycosyltransferase family 1 protein [Coriobacteriia bacterium]